MLSLPGCDAVAVPLELAIIVPTLNERDNLAPLMERIAQALGDTVWEALIVDDDSGDGTAEEARALALADPRIRVIQRIGRRGLASAAIEGFCATAAPFVAVMDADHQHDPALLPAMLAAVQSGEADIAIASRFLAGSDVSGGLAPQRERLSGVANTIARRITGTQLSDPMSGYFLMRADRARALAPQLSGIGFKILLDILSRVHPPMRVKEFPMHFSARKSGTSKLDRAIAFDFLAGLYDRTFGRVIPTRFALFGTVGAIGVAVHLAVLTALHPGVTATFWKAQLIATLSAMTFNFWLNNWLTYRDRRLSGTLAMLRGWLGFCAACAVGAFANVAVASLLEARGMHAILSALVGVAIGSVWNYALSSRFVWSRF